MEVTIVSCHFTVKHPITLHKLWRKAFLCQTETVVQNLNLTGQQLNNTQKIKYFSLLNFLCPYIKKAVNSTTLNFRRFPYIKDFPVVMEKLIFII